MRFLAKVDAVTGVCVFCSCVSVCYETLRERESEREYMCGMYVCIVCAPTCVCMCLGVHMCTFVHHYVHASSIHVLYCSFPLNRKISFKIHCALPFVVWQPRREAPRGDQAYYATLPIGKSASTDFHLGSVLLFTMV